MRSILLTAMLLSVSPAIAQSPNPANAGPIDVRDVWARATAPTATSGGIYLTLRDNGTPDRLVAAATPVAANADLHRTLDDNGISKMVPVPELALTPGKPVSLSPGGYHLMLTGLKQQLKPGDHFPVTLTFAIAPPVTVDVTVGKAGASGPDPMAGMDMSSMPMSK